MMRSTNRRTPFEAALDDITLSPFNKRILIERYSKLLVTIDRESFYLSISFHTSRSVITIGSLIVPALLSIQYTNSSGGNLGVYWTTWVISLCVTICNGLMTLLKIDKKYYHIHTVREQLISDGWQYLELTGKYSGFHTPDNHATHENQFIFFCHSVEKIRMKQIQEDYTKVDETPHPGAKAGAQVVPVNLIPPTPVQGDLENIPKDIKDALKELSSTRLENVPERGTGNP